MECVYPFTNENVTSYSNLYNFDNARVLSVLGSGDQYFASLLYGAKSVEVFDINNLAYDFFILKYYGILILNYDEFYDYFVVKGLDDLKYLKRLIPYIPIDVGNRLLNLYKRYKGLSKFLYFNVTSINEDGSCIPYFNKNKYYQLQSLLSNTNLPKFYLTNFLQLPSKVRDNNYNIILTSNIFSWLYMDYEVESVCKYRELLEKFNYNEIQALYYWNSLDNDLKDELLRNGFEIEEVFCAEKLSLTNKNIVISLRKVSVTFYRI